jgi:hypothetical protein
MSAHPVPLGPHITGARLTPEEQARLRAFCRGKADLPAATALGTTVTTLGKLLDGWPVKPEVAERVRARLP